MSIAATINDVRLELAMLSSRVEALERQVRQNGLAEYTAPFDLASIEPEVRRITHELFPGPCEFTHEFDPEYPEDRYVVVNVEATGEPKEIVDRECLWHERVWQLSEDWPVGILRLSVVPC
jgi:hypothetical protein